MQLAALPENYSVIHSRVLGIDITQKAHISDLVGMFHLHCLGNV